MSDNQKSEQSLWENVHQASKIFILPNSFTAGNLFFGFLSIILCVQGKFNAESTDRTIDHIAALITPNYTAGADASNAHGDRYDAMRVGWDEAGSLEEESSADKLATGVTKTGTIYWAGAMSTYFFNGVLPAKPENVTFKGVLQNQVYRVAIELEPFNAIPGQESVVSTLSVLLGPDGDISGLLTPLSAISLLVFCLLYTPCVAAIASIRRELGGKWALGIVIAQCCIAWICALAVRMIGLAVGMA